MEKYKYVVLGGGPAGLSFANMLLQKGEESFVVFEKESEAGGLCRSTEVDESPLDLGGGHFLDVRKPDVNRFLFQFMPEYEWNKFNRDSRIEFDGITINHPFEANIWQMPQRMQVEYLKSIANAGCNVNKEKPKMFIDWIRWKLGDLIADKYMIPYNSKMFGCEINQLGTYWLEKLPNVSFEETVLSCLNRKAYGTQPGHAQFYYPKKYGYGELWIRMATKIEAHMRYNSFVKGIDFNDRIVYLSDGSYVKADYIIFTIPWDSVVDNIGMPDELVNDIKKLKHTSVNITYYSEEMDTEAQWVYYPEISLPYHRVLIRGNFCTNSKGYWTETNSERYKDEGVWTFKNEYAYPLNTIDKPLIMRKVLDWGKQHAVIGLGRWGEWEHYNSDVTVGKAIDLANKLLSSV